MLFFLSTPVSAQWYGFVIDSVICPLFRVFRDIATGLAAVVMTIAGIKWIASENDPGARKAAKDAMVHAIVGLIIITIIGAVLSAFPPGLPPSCRI